MGQPRPKLGARRGGLPHAEGDARPQARRRGPLHTRQGPRSPSTSFCVLTTRTGLQMALETLSRSSYCGHCRPSRRRARPRVLAADAAYDSSANRRGVDQGG